MAIRKANSFVNASKTYKVDRLLPNRASYSANAGAALYKSDGTALTRDSEFIPLTNYNGTGGSITTNLSVKEKKPGETQYVSKAGEGLSPALAVKIGYKTGSNIRSFSTLNPERMDSDPGWAQVVISVEELFRASRITKIIPGESGASETYECFAETGHLPIQGWLCVRVPKHIAVTEEMIGAYMADLISAVVTNGDQSATSWTSNLMELVRGDVTL